MVTWPGNIDSKIMLVLKGKIRANSHTDTTVYYIIPQKFPQIWQSPPESISTNSSTKSKCPYMKKLIDVHLKLFTTEHQNSLSHEHINFSSTNLTAVLN